MEILNISLQKHQTQLFKKWFNKLPDNAQDKIAEYIDRVLEGNFSNCESVGNAISEIKINYQKGYRVYFFIQSKTLLVLLIGGDKSGNQKAQQNDIKKAKLLKKLLDRE